MKQARKSARQRKREKQATRVKRRLVIVAAIAVTGTITITSCTALTHSEQKQSETAEITTEAPQMVEMQQIKTARVNDPNNDIYPYNTISRDWGAGDLDGFTYYEIPEEYSNYGGCLPEITQIYTYCTCKNYGVDYATILAMIETESGYQWDVKAESGATGYMQIMPEHHTERIHSIGVENVDNPYNNIRTGVDCMAELLEKYQNNYRKALTAYKYGPTGAERKYFNKQKYTCEYAETVLEKADRIKEQLEQEH